MGYAITLRPHKGGVLRGIECKRTDAPQLTRSMATALAELPLERLAVVYPGNRRYSLADNVEVVPLAAIAKGESGIFP